MLVFGAIIFCLIFLVFVFSFALPLLLKIFQNKHNKKVEVNPAINLVVLFITVVTSLWIYAQVILIISGDTEQVKYNISELFSSSSITNTSENQSVPSIRKTSRDEVCQGSSKSLKDILSESDFRKALEAPELFRDSFKSTGAILRDKFCQVCLCHFFSDGDEQYRICDHFTSSSNTECYFSDNIQINIKM